MDILGILTYLFWSSALKRKAEYNSDVSFPILGNLNRAKTWAIGGGAAPVAPL